MLIPCPRKCIEQLDVLSESGGNGGLRRNIFSFLYKKDKIVQYFVNLTELFEFLAINNLDPAKVFINLNPHTCSSLN